MKPITVARPNAATGLFWIKEGWRLFKLAPVPWMGMTAFAFMLLIGLSMIPLVGRFAVELLTPFLAAGYFSAARAAQEGELVSFIHLGAGIQNGRDALLRIGLAYLVASLLIFVIVGHLTGTDLRELMQALQDPTALSEPEFNRLMTTALPAVMLLSLLYVPVVMATWFAPGLALFDGFSATQALWWSLWAGWVNWRPILYYGLVVGVLGMGALMIPFGLGLLAFMPLATISSYVAYRMIFVPVEAGDEDATEPVS
jgi:hypothetical protein